MSESASSNRPLSPQAFPVAPGSSGGTAPWAGDAGRPVLDEQPTVVSSDPPLAAPHVAESERQVCHSGLVPGDRLEHFELLEFVGGGGMGRVFRARDTRLGRVVALKVLAPGQTGDDDALARFQNEAQSAARLDHENIARVFHVGEHRGLHYIVFEYIEGVNLRILVYENGPLPVADAINYAVQVAEALAHAADRDVVHRDIKPSNVLITPSGRAKLIDMGLARLHKIDTVAADLTASGVTLGTFDYISPEQARDPRGADVRSDIYSLGCTFFFMLAGRPPFPEGTVLQKLLQHQGDEPPDVRQFRPDTPESLVSVLRRMLAKDPRNRYQAASELLHDLTALARQLGLRPLSPSGQVWELPRPPRIPRLARHLPWLAPTAALLLAVAAMHVWGGNHHPPPPLLGGPEEFFGEALPDPAEFAVAIVDDEVGVPAVPADSPADPNARVEEKAPVVDPPDRPPAPEPDRPATPEPSEQPADAQRPADPPEPEAAPPAPMDPPSAGLAGGRLEPEPASARLAVGPPGGTVVRLPEEAAESGRLALGARVPPPQDIPAARPPEASPQMGVLVVNGGSEEEEGFASLAAAVAAAETGNVIELRYDGPREQAPLKLASRRLTLRAGEGFQPVVVFRPDGNHPVKQPRSMVAVTSGELDLVNLALKLDVSRDVPAEQWSMFEVSGGARVNLRRCSLSIRNASDDHGAYHSNVVFFRTRPAPGTDRLTAGDPEPTAPPAAIVLADCAVRGQAVLLRAEAHQAVALDWENGLLATSEELLSVAADTRAPHEDAAAALNLRHLTASLGGGLVAMTDRQPARRQLPTSIVLSDSIVAGVPDVPLVDQYAAEGDEPRERIRFQGNRNFYEGIAAFWRLRGADEDEPPVLLDFDAWQSYWGPEDENLPSLNRVVWERAPDPTVPAHRMVVADFALAADAANPARGAASNGRDAGCDPSRLPAFP